MKCSHCGADNPEGAGFCNLCLASLEVPPERASDLGPPGQTAPGTQYLPPNVPHGLNQPPRLGPGPIPAPYAPQQAYMEPLPGSYPVSLPGGGPGPAGRRKKAAVVAVCAVLALVLIAGLGALVYLQVLKTAAIRVAPPPGWSAVEGETREKMESQIKNNKEMEGALDYFFTDGSLYNVILVFHSKSMFSDCPPENGSLEDMEAYIRKNKEELTGNVKSGIFQAAGYGVSAEVAEPKAVQLACGDVAIRMTMTVGNSNIWICCDNLLISKNKRMYAVMVMKYGVTNADNEIDFLKENISFK